MRAVKSLGVRLAGSNPDGEYCCRSDAVINSTGPVETPSKDERLKARCGRSAQTNCERSGVETMNFEPETLRQWMNVSSGNLLIIVLYLCRAKLRLTPKIRVNHSSYSAQLGQRIENDHHLGRIGGEHSHEITRLHVSSVEQGS